MLSHRLRCWPNIVPTLVEYLVFAGGGVLSQENQYSNLYMYATYIMLVLWLLLCNLLVCWFTRRDDVGCSTKLTQQQIEQ